MPRPSRNIDRLLIDAARALLPETGARDLSIRQLTERAGVNLGMFHYHFKTRDNFLDIVLQGMYEEMFAQLSLRAEASRSPLENLRAAFNVLGCFLRDNRNLLQRLLADALAGDQVALRFFQRNFPRHAGLVAQLVAQAQSNGELGPRPLFQAMSFIAGAVGMPILMATAAQASGFLPPFLSGNIEDDVMSDHAIAQRVDMALRGLQTQ